MALTCPQKSHPYPNDFVEDFTIDLRKQNITHCSFMSLTQNFCFAPERLLKNYLYYYC